MIIDLLVAIAWADARRRDMEAAAARAARQ